MAGRAPNREVLGALTRRWCAFSFRRRPCPTDPPHPSRAGRRGPSASAAPAERREQEARRMRLEAEELDRKWSAYRVKRDAVKEAQPS